MVLHGMLNTDDQHTALLIKVSFPQCLHYLSRLTCRCRCSLSWELWALSLSSILSHHALRQHKMSPLSQNTGINSFNSTLLFRYDSTHYGSLKAYVLQEWSWKWQHMVHISWRVVCMEGHSTCTSSLRQITEILCHFHCGNWLYTFKCNHFHPC